MPLPANNKFAKPGAAGAKPKPAAKPKPKPKKFGAATDQAPKDPMLDPGEYRVRHIGAEELLHPVKKSLSWRVQFVVLTEEGDSESPNIALFMNTTAGVAEFQRYCVAVAGYEDAATFNDFVVSASQIEDPEEAGEAFFTSVLGEANVFSEAGHTLERRLVDVKVTLGKPVLDKDTGQPTGDHYRNYKWTVVPDEEQDEAGKLEAS